MTLETQPTKPSATSALPAEQSLRRPTVSILIKALNEERHIARAIESAMAAFDQIDGEVVLADSRSSDRTIEIARQYPIKIVQLNRIEDRSWGVGAQLGFQYSSGEYLCLMDGDMWLYPDFVARAVQFLQRHPEVAGVGGGVIDRQIASLEFEQRVRRDDRERQGGEVTRLNSCGVYRRAAIESIGYLTDRNLHGVEELDVGARLQASGWKLARLDCLAVDHYGHTENAYWLLLRRIVTRNSFATGEVVRAALGRPHFRFVVAKDKNVLLCLMVMGWWAAMAAAALAFGHFVAVVTTVGLFLMPFAAMSLRWGSLRHGLYSVTAWNVYALSFLPGLLRQRVNPKSWIESTVLQTGRVLEPVASQGDQPAGARPQSEAKRRA